MIDQIALAIIMHYLLILVFYIIIVKNITDDPTSIDHLNVFAYTIFFFLMAYFLFQISTIKVFISIMITVIFTSIKFFNAFAYSPLIKKYYENEKSFLMSFPIF